MRGISKCTVLRRNKFNVEQGVAQRCSPSPVLFANADVEEKLTDVVHIC